MKRLMLTFLRLYKKYLSPSNFGVRTCRYEPSCSRYFYHAVEKHGIFKGSQMGIYRILRCNPFSKGGYDPVE